MLETKFSNLKNVDWVQPFAFLKDLDGVKLIVELPDSSFCFLSPPDYEIKGRESKDLAVSAVTKHSYRLCENESRIRVLNKKELMRFVGNIK